MRARVSCGTAVRAMSGKPGWTPPLGTVQVVSPGMYSSVQDYPGRIGRDKWRVGIPPSGPMDPLSHRLANRLVNNPDGAAALELTVRGASHQGLAWWPACVLATCVAWLTSGVSCRDLWCALATTRHQYMGPTLTFNKPAVIALTGARMQADLDGNAVPYHKSVQVQAGATLTLGSIDGAGARTYLAIAGGFDAEPYLGSKSTFPPGTLAHGLCCTAVAALRRCGGARCPLTCHTCVLTSR